MAMWSKQKHFGQKGIGEHATSLADALLSGKPLGRVRPANNDRGPKLKPRPKAVFGRHGIEEEPHGRPSKAAARAVRRGAGRGVGWKVWSLLLLTAVVTLVAVVALRWPSPTLGGRQLWTDIRTQSGWRVQCQVWTDQCRLIDDHDVRRTTGDAALVTSAFEAAIVAGRITPLKRHTVVLVHGLGRSSHSFNALANAFREQGVGVVAFNYASTRGTIAEHAKALNEVVGAFHGVQEVSFVTHSLGAVVVRSALAQSPAWAKAVRVGPSVFIAGPNQGSQVAQTLSAYAPLRWLLGPALKELGDIPAIKALPAPTTFATVSGTNDPLWFLDAPGDGLVSADETHLVGERRHLSVAAAHTFIMNDPRVMAFVTDFVSGR